MRFAASFGNYLKKGKIVIGGDTRNTSPMIKSAVTAGAANAPIPVIVDASGFIRFPPDIEAAAYFCISEAITNAVKHSQAGRIDVELRKGARGLEFVVGDNGHDAHRYAPFGRRTGPLRPAV